MRIGTMWSLTLVVAALFASCAAQPLGSDPSLVEGETLQTIEASTTILQIPVGKYESSKDIELILSLMGSHQSSVAVQKQALWKLAMLAMNSAENKVSIAASGGIEAVVRAMKKHTPSASVQEVGCWALLHLAEHAENRVAAKGGIDIVVRAMSAHRSDAGVQRRGCWALENMADFDPEKVVSFSFFLFVCLLCLSFEPQKGPRKATPAFAR